MVITDESMTEAERRSWQSTRVRGAEALLQTHRQPLHIAVGHSDSFSFGLRAFMASLLAVAAGLGCASQSHESTAKTGPLPSTGSNPPTTGLELQQNAKQVEKRVVVTKPIVLIVNGCWHIAAMSVGGISELDHELTRSTGTEWAGFVQCEASAAELSGHVNVYHGLPGLPSYWRIPFSAKNTDVVSIELPSGFDWHEFEGDPGAPHPPIEAVVAFRPQSVDVDTETIKSVEMRYFWSIGSGPYVKSLQKISDDLWTCSAVAGQPTVPLGAVFVIGMVVGSVVEVDVRSCEILTYRVIK